MKVLGILVHQQPQSCRIACRKAPLDEIIRMAGRAGEKLAARLLPEIIIQDNFGKITLLIVYFIHEHTVMKRSA